MFSTLENQKDVTYQVDLLEAYVFAFEDVYRTLWTLCL
jgi:hypothetical protein